MAKFCGKCGHKLYENTGLCPNCNKEEIAREVVSNEVSEPSKYNEQKGTRQKEKLARKQKREKKKAEKKAEKARIKASRTFWQKVKRFFVKLLVIILISAVMFGIGVGTLVYYGVVDIPVVDNILVWAGIKDEELSKKDYALEIVRAFRKNDIGKISEIIFAEEQYILDENFNVVTENYVSEIKADGILGTILKRTELDLMEMENGKFTYEVKSPDMSELFVSVQDDLSQEEFKKYISDYAGNAELREFEVEVEFKDNDGKITANYKTREFINAITGGLVDAYGELYSRYLEEVFSGD